VHSVEEDRRAIRLDWVTGELSDETMGVLMDAVRAWAQHWFGNSARNPPAESTSMDQLVSSRFPRRTRLRSFPRPTGSDEGAKTREHEHAHQGCPRSWGARQLNDFEKAAELANHIRRFHRRSASGKARCTAGCGTRRLPWGEGLAECRMQGLSSSMRAGPGGWSAPPPPATWRNFGFSG